MVVHGGEGGSPARLSVMCACAGGGRGRSQCAQRAGVVGCVFMHVSSFAVCGGGGNAKMQAMRRLMFHYNPA